MITQDRLKEFLYFNDDSANLIEIIDVEDFHQEEDILNIDKNNKDVWNTSIIDLCKLQFETTKLELLHRLEQSPQHRKLIDLELEKLVVKDEYESIYNFCIDNSLYPDNHTLYSFISEEIFYEQSHSRFFREKFEKNFRSFYYISKECLKYGSYAYYRPYLEELEKQASNANNIVIDQFKYEEIKLKNSSKRNKSNLEDILNTNEKDKFDKIIKSVYPLVKRFEENKNLRKKAVYYTTHLLIKNGWLKKEYNNKREFISLILVLFDYNVIANDETNFQFPKNEDLSNDDYLKEIFIDIYNHLEDKVNSNPKFK